MFYIMMNDPVGLVGVAMSPSHCWVPLWDSVLEATEEDAKPEKEGPSLL